MLASTFLQTGFKGPGLLDVMADALPTLEVLEEAMFTGSSWMYRLMLDLECRSPVSVVMLPQFRLLLAATTHTLNLLNKLSLEVIADDICIRRVVPNTVVTKSSKRAPKMRVKKIPKNGVAGSKIN